MHMTKKQVPEWWNSILLPVGFMMIWVGCVIGGQFLSFWGCICVTLICGGVSYQHCMRSTKYRKNSVSWFICWNAYGIIACLGIGFMVAAIYLGGVK